MNRRHRLCAGAFHGLGASVVGLWAIDQRKPADRPAPLMPEVALVLLPPQKDDLSSRLQEDPISGSGASSFRTEAEKDCADCFRFEALAAWLSGLPAERFDSGLSIWSFGTANFVDKLRD